MRGSTPETVLVTGASSGIGRELAREFARRGCPVVLAAPSIVELRQVADQITTESGVPVHTFARDLRTARGVEELSVYLESTLLKIDILANNAGLGHRGEFWKSPIDRDLEMIQVNIEAGLRLTKFCLPGMVARGHGRVLNTASVAGFEPGPLLAVYHATKAFVLSWSEALSTELENTGVTVTALCPGPVDTDFFVKADLLKTRAFQESNLMGPREVARAGVDGTLRGERLIIPGARNKISVFSRRFTSEAGQARMNEKLYQEAAPGKRKRERGDVEEKECARPN